MTEQTPPPEQHIPDERELSQPISSQLDQAYQVLANECGRRVWVVIDNLIRVRGRLRSDGLVGDLELRAILMGAMTGIGFTVARMNLGHEPGKDQEQPPEVLLLNDLGNQFLHVIEQMRLNDPIAMGQVKGPAEGQPVN